jgi:predicted RNA-binding protein with EMAP domain
LEEKKTFVSVEIQSVKQENEKLKGESLATKKWRAKYYNQINELELFLDTINKRTSMSDIKAKISVISEKYHPRDNL